MSLNNLALLAYGFFLPSFAIAIIAVIAGIGGGVLFTPLMLAFTPIDSLIIRGTGLIVAMFSGLISTGPFLKSGLVNLELAIYCSICRSWHLSCLNNNRANLKLVNDSIGDNHN